MGARGFEKRRPPIADGRQLDLSRVVEAHQMFEVHAAHATNAEDAYTRSSAHRFRTPRYNDFSPASGLPKETDMRGSWLPVLTLLALPLTLILFGAPAWAQVPLPTSRTVAVPVEPIIPTKIESLLTASNVVLVTDYYYVDTRFGPNLRIDAMVVEAVDEKTRLKGARVQVRDPESRGRQEGISYMDIEELVQLSNGLATIMKLEPRWTHDDRRATESTFTTTGGHWDSKPCCK